MCSRWLLSAFFFFNDTATTEIYTLSLHDALPICPRGESPAIGGVGLDSFGPNPTANSVGAEEGGSSGARTTIQLGTDGVRHGARFPRRARGKGLPLHQPPHRTSAMALAGLRAKLWPMFVLQIVLPIKIGRA